MSPSVLVARSITKTFVDGDVVTSVLRGAEVELRVGEFVALMGPSGSGKSTLLNILGTLLRPTSGQLVVVGRDVTHEHQVELTHVRNRHIGFVFQFHHLLPDFTALENVLLGMTFARNRKDPARAHHLLDRVGLSHRATHRPTALSVGEQQRVAVARALANRPSLLLADEPTANIDPRNQQKIVDLIRDTCREENISLIIVTHSLDVAGQFQRVDKLEEINLVTANMQTTTAVE